jgi:hypothetical protein
MFTIIPKDVWINVVIHKISLIDVVALAKTCKFFYSLFGELLLKRKERYPLGYGVFQACLDDDVVLAKVLFNRFIDKDQENRQYNANMFFVRFGEKIRFDGNKPHETTLVFLKYFPEYLLDVMYPVCCIEDYSIERNINIMKIVTSIKSPKETDLVSLTKWCVSAGNFQLSKSMSEYTSRVRTNNLFFSQTK